jgi:malonyl-CoA O-methyltransferase
MTYGTVRDLMRDLKAIGAHNVTAGRPRGLGGRQALAAAEEYYEAWRRNGVLPATYEVVYGHAWAPAGTAEQAAGGRAVVQFHRRMPKSPMP